MTEILKRCETLIIMLILAAMLVGFVGWSTTYTPVLAFVALICMLYAMVTSVEIDEEKENNVY